MKIETTNELFSDPFTPRLQRGLLNERTSIVYEAILISDDGRPVTDKGSDNGPIFDQVGMPFRPRKAPCNCRVGALLGERLHQLSARAHVLENK